MKKLFAVSLFSVVLAASTAFALHLPEQEPVKGTEGPDVRLVAFAFPGGSDQPVKGIEGPDVSLTEDDQRPSQPIKGMEGPDVN
jgi:hypothetical protein